VLFQVGGASQIFFMNSTNPFHPAKSLSFAHVLFVGFSLTYADSAGLSGYIAQVRVLVCVCARPVGVGTAHVPYMHVCLHGLFIMVDLGMCGSWTLCLVIRLCHDVRMAVNSTFARSHT
jgi:hypothetical protein